MGRLVAVLLTILVISPALFSQIPATNQPLQVKEGLWDVTVTNHFPANSPPNLPEAALDRLPPEQRERVLAALKSTQAKGQTRKLPFCLTHEHLLSGDMLSGDIFDVNVRCTTQQVTSSSEKLTATQQCGIVQRVTTIERVSDTTFTGDQSVITHNTLDTRINSTFSATWVRADCSEVENSAAQAEEAEQAPPQPKEENVEQAPRTSKEDSRPAPTSEPTVAVVPTTLPYALSVCFTPDNTKGEACVVWIRAGEKAYAGGGEVRRFDSGGVLFTSQNTASGENSTFTGKLEGNKIHGTYTASSIRGRMKGTWHATFFQPPAAGSSTSPSWNVYVTHIDTVFVINSATHGFKTVSLPSGTGILGLAVSPDGSKAYVTTVNGVLYVVDGATGSLAATFSFKGTVMPFGFMSVAVSPDGATLYGNGATASGLGIGVMDAASGKIRHTIAIPGSKSLGPMVLIGNRLYAVMTGLKVIDVTSGKVVAEYQTGGISLGVSGDGRYLYNYEVGIDTVTGKESVIGLDTNGELSSIAISPDGTTAYQSSGVNEICVANLKAGYCGTKITVGGGPEGVAVTPDGKTLFEANLDGTVYTIDTQTNRVTDVIPIGGMARPSRYVFRVGIQPVYELQ